MKDIEKGDDEMDLDINDNIKNEEYEREKEEERRISAEKKRYQNTIKIYIHIITMQLIMG